MNDLTTLKGYHHFIPSQPEIECNTDNYIELKPVRDSIRKNIALFYQFKTRKDSVNSFSVIPDGCFDILFRCSSKRPLVFLWTSPLKRSAQLDFEADCEYFGVRFLPEQGIVKLNYSMKELIDKKIPLGDIMSFDPFIVEKIGVKKNFAERIKTFEAFIERFNSELNYQKIIKYTVNQIYSFGGKVSVDQLSRDTGYSDRYLRKIFEENIGFSPKRFSEIVRFQNILATLVKSNSCNFLDIVYENGYHDHAHFIKCFKKFANFTPKQFREQIYLKTVST